MQRRNLLVGAGALATLGLGGGALFEWQRASAMADYRAATARMRAALAAHPALPELVRHATLAANGHNTQPWRFRLAPGRLDILPDFARRTPAVDPDDHHLFVSLGGAIQNAAIAAAGQGIAGQVVIAADGRGASLRLGEGEPAYAALAPAIVRRQSSRTLYDGRPVAPATLRALEAAAAEPGVSLALLTGRAPLAQVRDLVVAGNDAQMADVAFVRELRRWLRFSPDRALALGDGLFSACSGSPVAPEWLGRRLFDRFFTPAGERDRYASQLASSSGVAVFVGASADPAHWMAVGRASQRFTLAATAAGLKCAYVNQPVEVPRFRAELAQLAGLPGRRPDLLIRFGHGPALPYSPRRPVRAVLA